jgi:SpoIID/LytB domain protein
LISVIMRAPRALLKDVSGGRSQIVECGSVRLTVHGSRGSVTLRGNDFRRLVGYDTLKSTLFAVAVDGEMARFAGRGYGHGVGLDQWSAKTMAEQGYPARQIVEYYYPGATFAILP